jgi:anti-anti-sigma regulatory factor
MIQRQVQNGQVWPTACVSACGEFHVSIRFDQSQTLNTIFLEGAIDISSAAELKRILIEAIDSKIGLLVSLARTTALDVTTLQLLHAAEREAETSGVGFRIVGPLACEILASLRDVDLQTPLICEETNQESGEVSCRP